MDDNTHKDKDEVYAENGYKFSPVPTPFEIKDKEVKMNKAMVEVAEENNMAIKVTSEESLANGNKVELPLRVAYAERKISLSRLPIWFLTSLGSLSISELEEFKVKYKDELSLNEIAAMDLLYGVLSKDKDSVNTFWTIQQKMLNKTNIANQINISVTNKDTAVSHLLDEITNKLKDGQVISDTPAGN